MKTLAHTKNSLQAWKTVTTESYEICKQCKIKLIGVREISARKPLFDTLKFWDSIKSRWATFYREGLCNIPKSSLAGAVQASMKAPSEKNISLVDATHANITDSARLDAKWINWIGEESRGSGPSQAELDKSDEARQINRAKRYIEEASNFNDDLTSSPWQSNTALPMVKWKRSGLTETSYFREFLRKSLLKECQTRVLWLT